MGDVDLVGVGLWVCGRVVGGAAAPDCGGGDVGGGVAGVKSVDLRAFGGVSGACCEGHCIVGMIRTVERT